MLIAYWLYEPSLWWYKTCVRCCNIFVYGADDIAPMVIYWLHRCYMQTLLLRCCWALCKAQMLSCLFWSHRCYMQSYCPDVIEHCVRHRCSHACFFIICFWHKCWCALFVARMLLGQSSIISFSVLGCWIVNCPRCVGDCTFQYSYWV